MVGEEVQMQRLPFSKAQLVAIELLAESGGPFIEHCRDPKSARRIRLRSWY